MQSIVLRSLRSMLGMVRMLAIAFNVTLITAMVMTTPTQAAIIYVDQDSTAGSGATGTTWELAYEFLADGLAAADPQADPPDEVWVAAGEDAYRPDQSLANPTGTGNRALAFALKRGVAVYGGFSGAETSRDQRDPQMANPTYLSGDLDGDDDYTATGFLDDPPDYSLMAENSYRVCTAISASSDPEDLITESTVLDGFIVQGGNANGSVFYDIVGAGLFCGGPPSDIFVTSSPTVARTRFEFNHAGNEESPTSGGYAAAVYSSYGDPVLRDLCTFADNHAKTCAGATILDTHGDFTVLGCTYQNNRAGRNSGAHQSRSQTGTTRIHGCQFIDNIVVGEQANNAGAILLLGTAGELLNTGFRGNLAPTEGGAARIQDTTVTNCTFSGNATTEDTNNQPGGGAVHAVGGNVTIKNTILWANVSAEGDALESQITGTFTTAYCDIQTEDGNPLTGTGHTNNIEDDPEFKGTDNLRLTKCSPCIDKGDLTDFPDDDEDIDGDGVTDEPTPDADIHERLLDGDADSNEDIDMGAYEYDPDCPADVYVSGAVNGTDLALLLGAWTGQEIVNPCPDEDLSGDCRVNGVDLAILLGA